MIITNYKTYKYLSIFLGFLFLFSVVTLIIFFPYINEGLKSHPNIKISKDIVTPLHRLAYCRDHTSVNITYLDSNIDGYIMFVDCNFKINNIEDIDNLSGDEYENEYFGIQNVKSNKKFYIDDNKKFVLGTPNILGIKDNILFINYCHEGCGYLESIDLSYLIDDISTSITTVYPRSIRDFLYFKLNLKGLSEPDLFIINNRVILIDLYRIYELNTKDFSLKTLLSLKEEETFYYDSYRADMIYTKKQNGIDYNVYSKASESNPPIPIRRGFLEIK